MRSRSFSVLAVTTAALMFGALTDEASSHKLSSLAVRAFDGVVGTAIELVKPSSPRKGAAQQSTASAKPAAASSSVSPLDSPALVRTKPVEGTSFDATLAPSLPATVTEDQGKEDKDVASNSFGPANFGFRSAGGIRPLSGGTPGSGGEQGALTELPAPAEAPPSTSIDAARWTDGCGRIGSRPRLWGLDGRILAGLHADDENHRAVWFALWFDVGPAASCARHHGPIKSERFIQPDSCRSAAADIRRRSGPYAAVRREHESRGCAAPSQPAGQPDRRVLSAGQPFDIVPTLTLDGLVPNPPVSPTDLVDESLILPPNIAPVRVDRAGSRDGRRSSRSRRLSIQNRQHCCCSAPVWRWSLAASVAAMAPCDRRSLRPGGRW